jgi:hypothetical protein
LITSIAHCDNCKDEFYDFWKHELKLFNKGKKNKAVVCKRFCKSEKLFYICTALGTVKFLFFEQ